MLIYDQVKTMAVEFVFKPGDRINEGALARKLGVSRTPLREVLNRLSAEKLFTFVHGEGFYCRTLEPKEIFDLYECRNAIECAAIRLACQRASEEELHQLAEDLDKYGMSIKNLTIAQACKRDEAFHLGIAKLSQNNVLVNQLQSINERIRYVRWISMSQGKAKKTKGEHQQMVEALLGRKPEEAVIIMTQHIDRRMEQIVDVVGAGLANIYMASMEDIKSRTFKEVSS